MPPILAFPSFIYTEENGFSYGAALSALNLTGRGMSLSARAYFGGTTQRWARFSDPWIRGNHVSFEFFGGKRDRADILNGFEEDSWEFSPEAGHLAGQARPAAGIGVALQDGERRGRQDARRRQRGPVPARGRRARVRHARFVARPPARLEERARDHPQRRRRLLLDDEPRRAPLPADRAPAARPPEHAGDAPVGSRSARTFPGTSPTTSEAPTRSAATASRTSRG